MSLRLSGGRRLQSPPGNIARPTPSRVRLAVMNMLAAELPGSRWLDLFCGSGVMGCEALQRGAAAVVAVDQQRAMTSTSRTNLELTDAGIEVKLFIEHSTDSGSSSPVSVAGEKQTTELIELMKPWVSAIMDADVIGAWKMREQLWRDLPAVKNV